MRWDWVWPSEGGQDHRLGILILSGWKSDLCEQASTSPEYQTPDWGLGRAPCGKTHSHWGQGGTWSRLMLSGSWGSTFSKVMNSLERCFKTDRGFYRESLQKAWDGWPVNCLLTPRLSGSMQGSSDCMSPRCLGTGANQMALPRSSCMRLAATACSEAFLPPCVPSGVEGRRRCVLGGNGWEVRVCSFLPSLQTPALQKVQLLTQRCFVQGPSC